MQFRKDNVRLVNARQFTSKAGQDLTFLKIADVATFDSEEFLAPKGFDFNEFPVGQDYDLILDINGNYKNITLLHRK